MEEVNIFIARHGQTDCNRDRILQGRGINAPLNDVGINQAQALATYLSKKRYSALYTSSMKRAIQTSEIIAEASSLPISTHQELDEMDYGIYEGKQYTDVADDLEIIKNSWDEGNTELQIEAGESPEDVLNRAKPIFLNIIQSHPGESILMVLHGRLIRILLSHFLRSDLKQMEAYQISNCELNHLVYEGDCFKVQFLNKCEYLNTAQK